MKFDLDQLISKCKKAVKESAPRAVINEILARAVCDPASVFGIPRNEWDAETLLEQPCDGDKMLRRFEQANALLGKA